MRLNDFLKSGTSKKIIICNKVSVANALIRQANIKDGVIMFNTESKKVISIAKELLSVYRAFKGEADINYADKISEIFVMEEVLKAGSYKTLSKDNLSIETAKEILSVIKDLRMSQIDSSFNTDKNDKISDLRDIYAEYDKTLKLDNLCDDALVLEEATNILSEVADNKIRLDKLLPWIKNTKFGKLEKTRLYKKEQKFLDNLEKASANYGTEFSTIEFLPEQTEADDAEPQSALKSGINKKFFKTYGVANEIQKVISEIKSKNIPYGNITVYYSSASYIKFLKAQFDNAGIPYSLTSSVSASEYNLVQFMLAVLKTAREDFLYASLNDVVLNKAISFDSSDNVSVNPITGYRNALKSGIGWGKDRYLEYYDRCMVECNQNENDPNAPEWLKDRIPGTRKFAEFLKDFVEIFDDSYSAEIILDKLIDFTVKYTFKTNMEKMVVLTALENQKKSLHYLKDNNKTLNEKIDSILLFINEISMRNDLDTSAVALSPMNGLFVVEREDNYFVGLNASSFSLDTKQSSVMLDEEKKKYMGVSENDALDSAVTIKSIRNQKRRKDMVDSLRTMRAGNVTFLYSFYDTVELKDQTPAIIYLQLSKGEQVETVNEYDYISDDIHIASEDIIKTVAEKAESIRAEKEKKEAEKKERAKKYLERLNEDADIANIASIEEDNVANADDSDGEAEDVSTLVAVDETPSQAIKVARLSASGLQTLLGCPIAYYYKYMKKLSVYTQRYPRAHEWLDSASSGTFCHNVLEKYYADRFPCSQPLGKAVDSQFLADLITNETEEMLKVVPCPTDVIKGYEVNRISAVLEKYLKKEYDEWNKDKNSGKEWQVIGCELKFDDLSYKDSFDVDYQYELALNGSIDRLDAYVKADTIYCRVIDYKSGRNKNKLKEIDLGKQIQHYFYSMATVEYIRNNYEAILAAFNVEKLDKIVFEKVAYIFPFDEEDELELDVTESINKLTTGSNINDMKIELPDEVRSKLRRVIGAAQNGKVDELPKNFNEIVSEIMQKINYLEAKAEAEKDSNAIFSTQVTEMPTDFSKEKLCDENYCDYTNICRKVIEEV